MYFKTLLCYTLTWQTLPITCQTVIPLDGNTWTLTNSEKNISVPAKVPGSVHLDLQQAKVTGDPYYGNFCSRS